MSPSNLTLRFLAAGGSLLTGLFFAAMARAQPAPAETPAPVEAPKPKPPPYSLPFQLRPVVVGNVVRSDTAFAFYEAPASAPNAGNAGSTVVTTLLGTLKVTDQLAPL